MKPTGYRRNTLPLLLIVAGVLWLLFQTGFVPPRALAALAFYWPVLLIGVGLDLLRLRGPWGVPYTGLAVLVVVLAAVAIRPPDTGATVTHFREPVGAARSASVRVPLRSGSGPVTFEVPNTAAVRLEAQADGSGPLRVAPFLTRRSGSGDTGVWQSAAVAGAAAQILITVASAGSGSITIR